MTPVRTGLLLLAFASTAAVATQPTCLRRVASWAGRSIQEFFYYAKGLRYRVVIDGVAHIRSDRDRGTLVLAGHPAYVDPPILVSTLTHYGLSVRPVIKETETDGLLGDIAVGASNSIVLPAILGTADRREAVRRARQSINEIVSALERRENVLLYPSGRLLRGDGIEDVRNKGLVNKILREVPDVRILLVKTEGLFGSLFGYGRNDEEPVLNDAARRAAGILVENRVLFTPRREVTIRITEPSDFPRSGDQVQTEDYLWNFFNNPPVEFREVPYFRGG